MGLTVANFWGLFSVGTYENGDFQFSITAGEMFPTAEDERATTLKTYTEAGLPLPSAMRKAGFSEQEIQTALGERSTEDSRKSQLQTESLANAMSNFNAGG